MKLTISVCWAGLVATPTLGHAAESFQIEEAAIWMWRSHV
jgi:hypothetical protein